MMRKKIKKIIPEFKTAEEAAIFWERNNILDFFDEDEFDIVNPRKDHKYYYSNKIRPEKKLISIRIDKPIIAKAKLLSKKKHLNYQQILRQWLFDGAEKEA